MSRTRYLLLSFLALLGMASAANPQPAKAQQSTEMSWSLVSRFGGDADGDGRLDRQTPKWLANLNVFPVMVSPPGAVCRAPKQVSWSIDQEPLLRVKRVTGAPCRFLVGLSRERRHTVEAKAGETTSVAQVRIDDRLVVALGDSIASGEGNPQGPERWLDRPCHRSALAGFEQAARLLAQGLEERSITFVSLACSGAEVKEGLLEPYAGVAPDARVGQYAPQVERLLTINGTRDPPEGSAGVDAVVLSVGANDVQFSSVVKACAAPGDCRRDRQEQIFSDLERLRGNYDLLGESLKSSLPDSPVLITEYFDPTRDQQGRFCRSSVAFTTQGEARWAYEALLRPLNAVVAAGAVRNGWHYIGGVADDFQQHGYCADKANRWVRRLTGSLFTQSDLSGTLHPSLEGHLAIAQRTAVGLGQVLGLAVPAQSQAADNGRSFWEWLGIVTAAALAGVVAAGVIAFPIVLWPTTALAWLLALLALVLFVVWELVRRLLRLLRPTNADPFGKPAEAPDLESLPRPTSAWQLVALAGAVVALILFGVLFAGVVGSVILWLRFWSAHLPADQSVDAVARSELVTTGTQAVALFLFLGLIAVGVAWMLDGKGRWVRSTRRGLLAIAVVELIAGILIGDFRRTQALELAAGLLVAALLVHFLVDRALELKINLRSGEPWQEMNAWMLRLWERIKEGFRQARPRSVSGAFRIAAFALFRLAPIVLLAFAIIESFQADDLDRLSGVLLPLFGAALLFVLPWGLAHAGTGRSRPKEGTEAHKNLESARIALALAALVCVFVLITRDAAWLAATAGAALLLALFCLAVAAVSKESFAPYGLAILVSVPLFGAAAAMLRGVDSPELQPVAAILKSGAPVCGLYIGESEGKLWVGHSTLDEQGDVRRPPRGSIASVDSNRIAERVIGPLEPVARAQRRAVELRDQLLNAHGDKKVKRRLPTCAPAEPVLKVPQTWQRELAERYQPELIIDREDGFWPIPVGTLFSMQDRRASICRQVARGSENCLRLTTQGEFPWAGGKGEALEYPAAETSIDQQHDLMVDALGSAAPDTTATEYFLVAGKPGGSRPITIQYWFFYPFNYLRVGDKFLAGGRHEGDFESVGVVLSARTLQPRYLWMSRHEKEKEGRIFPWDEEQVGIVDGHPLVFVARGSHASYESCAHQVRYVARYRLVDDYPTCDEGRQLHLAPEATLLTDLSHVSWACWQGHFGHRVGGRVYERIPYLVGDAPLSPLWQQDFDGVEAKPCAGINDPGFREGPGEETVEEGEGVPERIRAGAGRLDLLIDECRDWEKPPTVGVYMVVCNQEALSAHLASGLEQPVGADVRIDDVKASDLQVGSTTLPAVRFNRERAYLDSWRIVATKPVTVTIYASCQQNERIVGARFSNVSVNSADPLQLVDHAPGGMWRLSQDDGTTVAQATPFVLREGDFTETALSSGTVACSSGD